MNKRQWKKKYKKEHGCNPPSSRQVYKLEDALSLAVNRLWQMVRDMLREITNVFILLGICQSMSLWKYWRNLRQNSRNWHGKSERNVENELFYSSSV